MVRLLLGGGGDQRGVLFSVYYMIALLVKTLIQTLIYGLVEVACKACEIWPGMVTIMVMVL